MVDMIECPGYWNVYTGGQGERKASLMVCTFIRLSSPSSNEDRKQKCPTCGHTGRMREGFILQLPDGFWV